MRGRLRSALVIGGQGIRARKFRTFLSMVSLFMGVLAVVTVQAGASILERSELDGIEMYSGKDGTITLRGAGNHTDLVAETLRGTTQGVLSMPVDATLGEPNVNPINRQGMTFEDVRRHGRSTGADYDCMSEADCEAKRKQKPLPEGNAIRLNIEALTGDIRPIRPFTMVSGQWLDFGSTPMLAPRIVINQEAAKFLGHYKIPNELQLGSGASHPSVQITGVVNDGAYGPAAYVRLDEMSSWAKNPAGSRYSSGPTVFLQPGSDDLQRVLRSKLVAAGAKDSDIRFEAQTRKEDVTKRLLILKVIFLGLAGLVLLVGVAGILNVGLATINERVEEFALRRAVGMPRLLLAGIVLAETLLVGLFTAAVAIGVGYAGLEVVGSMAASRLRLSGAPPFPWDAGLAGVIAGLLGGVLGGLIPAIRAARIPIATVMRA
ncbi:ABC transporter permease [Pseudonocardiaceae bacterium YIM PH 21723]|nr:ABC transporter permease [Pseudonocardiaceae bacterium YIM PH 21723]